MYLTPKASRVRLREAQNARNNRAEIVQALGAGQITRRDLIRWGIFTAAGGLALKNGLSPYAQSAYGAVPTGVPPTPMFGATKFSQPFRRLNVQTPVPLTPLVGVNGMDQNSQAQFTGNYAGEHVAKCMSWHTDFNAAQGADYRNPLTNRGPCEGRPPGENFAHQRWTKVFPQKGYVMSLAQIESGTKFHPMLASQGPNAVWSFGQGNVNTGMLPAPLIKARYGEPMLMRIYNKLPVDRAANGGFGRNECTTHFHNAHNGAVSDGACNAYYFPGQFYDYHWGTTLARADMAQYQSGSDFRASGPGDHPERGQSDLMRVPGDFRELQGTLWFHDHRFFFTAENVYKGHAGMVNMYSGPDRGAERVNDGVNLQLPSGIWLPWGNVDFDVNIMVSDFATSPDGQLFFDIFNTDGFLGDRLNVNHTYAPVMDVLPRKYRFRILNSCMSRFVQLALTTSTGVPMPFQFIANDGNFIVSPVMMFQLDQQGIAERYDIIVDFSRLRVGDWAQLVNVLQQTDGRKPDVALALGAAIAGTPVDTAVGPIMKFRVVSSVQSVDDPTQWNTLANCCGYNNDKSKIPLKLTEQIPIVAPVRERVVEWGRFTNGDSRNNPGGVCIPDCAEIQTAFPWSIKVNGQAAHSLNGNRVSIVAGQPGEIEHWTYINGGGGWDHPIHLHFEEGITMNRGNGPIGPTEKLVRKDVWRLRPAGTVQFQIQWGEFGGAYVNHCHNTVHEDWAMLLRYDIPNKQYRVWPTPIPTPDGVTYMTPEELPEASGNFNKPA